MHIETTFNCGDSAWCITMTGIQQLTIGEIRVTVTDSPGYEDSMFDNYKPQKNYEEWYMCVETGIGSGSLYEMGRTIFPDYESAKAGYKLHQEIYG